MKTLVVQYAFNPYRFFKFTTTLCYLYKKGKERKCIYRPPKNIDQISAYLMIANSLGTVVYVVCY